MKLEGSTLLVVGGAGLIGSHTVDQLIRENTREIRVYDNFVRGRAENLRGALTDPRVKIWDAGGDILQTDILESAMDGVDGVFHFAALWLLQCHEFPRSAFDVNIRGTFNVMEACVKQGVKRLVYSSSASVYGDAVKEPMDEGHPFNNKNFYGATKIAGEAMLRAFHHRYGLDYVGLRYMNVYGPRQDYVENSWASCGCTTPERIAEPIQPGASAKLKVQYNAAAVAPFTKDVNIKFAGIDEVKTVKITGEVLSTEAFAELQKQAPKAPVKKS